MKLRVLLPTHVAVEEDVRKVTAEAVDGSFCLLPRHVDVVAPLVPGILAFEAAAGERFLAVNGGLLVKCGDEVLVSTIGAVAGQHLEELEQAVEESFEHLNEREQRVRSAMEKMEADFVRRFIELQERA